MIGLPSIPVLISLTLIVLIALPIHELAHAYTAVQMGDETPRRMGRLSLNPLVHLDILGTLLIYFVGFGWAKPVQVNPYNLRSGPSLGMAIVAAAGPFANLVLAILAAIPFRLGLLDGAGSFVRGIVDGFIRVNIVLLLFNLIPIAPLDGSKIVRAFAPPSMERLFMQLDQWGPFLLMALLMVPALVGGPGLGLVLGGPVDYIHRALVGV
jgi:Zn-dependent protease